MLFIAVRPQSLPSKEHLLKGHIFDQSVMD